MEPLHARRRRRQGRAVSSASWTALPQVLVCTHATLRFAYDKIDAAPFANSLLAIDEFHHVSAERTAVSGRLCAA